VTHDLDFGIMLISSGATNPSVIQVRCKDMIFDALADLILFALRHAEVELKEGALVTLDAKKIRIRRLSRE
jgi:predicted nuclease of predicted toxin-antitoxin system